MVQSPGPGRFECADDGQCSVWRMEIGHDVDNDAGLIVYR